MNCRRLLMIGVFAVGLCLVVSLLGLAAYFVRGPSTVAGPVVAILSPDPGEQVRLGDVVAVHSTSRDEAHQVVKVELWVDGTLIEVDTSPEGASTLSIVQGWQPLSPGFHTLLVRAFNEADVHGQATIGVETVLALVDVAEDRPSAPEDIPTIGEIMGGAQIPPELEVLPPPGGFPSDEEGDEPEEFRVFPHPDWGPLSGGVRDPLLGGLIPSLLDVLLGGQGALPPTIVEFAALDFEVQEDYEEIYCYASLSESDGPVHVARVPEDEGDFFRPEGERHWNIAEHLGGQNRRVVSVPLDQPLRVFLQCHGWPAGEADAPDDLGTLDVSHPRGDWGGQVIRGSGVGGEGFDLEYTISVFAGPADIPAPSGLQLVDAAGTNYLHWTWDGDQEQIYGFRIYQNDRLVDSVAPSKRNYLLSPLSLVPPCAEQFEYQVKAFRGELGPEGLESPPSNVLLIEGSPCGGEDTIDRVQVIERRCSGAVQELEVKYEYNSDHGEASMGALAFKDGSAVSRIHYDSTRIEQFESSSLDTAHVWLEYHGSDTVTTDELVVLMYGGDRRPFYVKRIALNLTWPAPQPDLAITYADIDAEGGLVSVRIQNVGCAPVDEPFTLRLVSRDVGVGGTTTVAEIDAYLNPQETYVWETQYDPVWAAGFTASVDTEDRIAEPDEDNNYYEKGNITLKAVEFYMIDVHRPRETYYEFMANEKGARRPQIIGGKVVLAYGLHEMGGMWFENVTLSPELDWNEDLLVLVCLYEGDYREACADRWHSHDISEEDSWKRGGEFAATSTGDYFTFYWRLILE